MSILLTLLLVIIVSPNSQSQPTLPTTRQMDHTYTIHGVVVSGPYRWLENDRDAEVEAWAAKQFMCAIQPLGIATQ